MGVWLIVLIVFAGYALLHLVAYLIQDYFFFHPEKLGKGFRFRYDIPFEEILLDGVNGSVIDALYFPVPDSRKVVFYFKGNTRSIRGWAKFARDFTSKGYDFFLIDYPGFGKSTGKRNEQTIYNNAQVAYDWLKSRRPENEIVIYGRSLGAGFAAYIASRNHPALIILDSPFFTFHQLVAYYTRILVTSWFLKYKMPVCDYIRDTHCPVHIIHGDRDRLIPYRYSLQICNLDPDRIVLHTIKGARHNNLPKFEEYHRILGEVLGGKTAEWKQLH